MKRLQKTWLWITGILLAGMVCLLAGCQEAAAWQEQYDLGMQYLTESHYQEAILAFTAAIEIAPKQADTYVYLTQAYLAAGDPASAEQTRSRVFAETGDARLGQSAAEDWVIYKDDIPFEQQLIYRDPGWYTAGCAGGRGEQSPDAPDDGGQQRPRVLQF